MNVEELIETVEAAALLEHPNLEHLVMLLSDGENWAFVPLYPHKSSSCTQEVADRLGRGMYLIGAGLYQNGLCKVVELGRGEEAPELVHDGWAIYDASLRGTKLAAVQFPN